MLRISAFFFVALLTLTACTAVGPKRDGGPDHHHTSGFENLRGVLGSDPIEFLIDRARLAFSPPEMTPVIALSADEAAASWAATGTADAVQWLGHASLRLRLAGTELLIDPVYKKHMSPLPPLGPSRASPPPVLHEALTGTDAILVTHNHYDHYEPRSIARIVAASGARCIAPLGVIKPRRTNCAVTELDWHQTATIGTLRITLLPSQHESGRGLFDRNHTLWGAFLIEGGGKKIYIGSDSGYGPHLAEAGRQTGGVDLAAIAVGGYKPRTINQHVHMSPEEALRAMGDLRARHAIVVHWGTYPLGLENGSETYTRLTEGAAKAGIGRNRLWMMRIGEARRLP